MRNSQTFVVRFRADTNGIRALRALLKLAWRCHRLRCVEAYEENDLHDGHASEPQHVGSMSTEK
jgi:hypothetical protein